MSLFFSAATSSSAKATSDEKHVAVSLSTEGAKLLKALPITALVGGQRKRKGKGSEQSSLFNPVGAPPRYKVPTSNQVFSLVQGFQPSALTSNIGAATYAAYTFQFSDLDQYVSLGNVFDQYMIEWVEVWITPRLPTPSATATNTGVFYSVLDFDDGAPLTTLASALDYENVLIGTGTSGHYRRFRPHVAVAAYSGTFTSFANAVGVWIDVVSPSVVHYGVKTAWASTDVAYVMNVQCRYHVKLRNVR